MSWPVKKIGDVCDVIPGFAFKSKVLGQKGVPVIKISNIADDHAVDIASVQCLPENLVIEKYKKFRLGNGDILLAMTGATAGKVGRIRCADDQGMLLNQRVAKLCPRDINPDYFWFAISTDRYRTIFYGLGGGAAQPNMSGTQIESVEIPSPPLPIQTRIASILSAYDDLIEKTGGGYNCWNSPPGCSTRNGSSTSASPATNTSKSKTASRRGGKRKRLGMLHH